MFRISANDNGEPMDVWIESNNDHISFYVSGGATGNPNYPLPIGPNNKQRLSVSGNTNVDIGVKIDLENVDRTGEVFQADTGFTVHAEDTD